MTLSVAQSNSRPSSFQVVVGPNERLSDIAVKYLGISIKQRLHQIQALNPKLTDPDHIEAGQKLWLPGAMPVKQPDNGDFSISSSPAANRCKRGQDCRRCERFQGVSFEITVEPNQTLQDIAMKYLGDFDLKRLHQIQALNPKLTDPDHIETGQKIWLPGPPPVPVAKNATPPANARKLP